MDEFRKNFSEREDRFRIGFTKDHFHVNRMHVEWFWWRVLFLKPFGWEFVAFYLVLCVCGRLFRKVHIPRRLAALDSLIRHWGVAFGSCFPVGSKGIVVPWRMKVFMSKKIPDSIYMPRTSTKSAQMEEPFFSKWKRIHFDKNRNRIRHKLDRTQHPAVTGNDYFNLETVLRFQLFCHVFSRCLCFLCLQCPLPIRHNMYKLAPTCRSICTCSILVLIHQLDSSVACRSCKTVKSPD